MSHLLMENNATRHQVRTVWSRFSEHDSDFIFAESSKNSPRLNAMCQNKVSASPKYSQQNSAMLSVPTEMSAGIVLSDTLELGH